LFTLLHSTRTLLIYIYIHIYIRTLVSQSSQNFLKQVKETSAHIGEYVNLYQVHSATFESGILSDARVHEALHTCRKENGWKIGLSVSSTSQDELIREAMKITVEDGDKLFDSVQCTYNILEQKPYNALVEAKEANMDIIIKEGLANGRSLRHPKLVQVAEKMGCKPDELALGCILAQPFQPRVLSGAVTTEQLESNLGAMDIAERLKTEGDLLKEVMDGCVMDSETYWKDRSALAWN